MHFMQFMYLCIYGALVCHLFDQPISYVPDWLCTLYSILTHVSIIQEPLSDLSHLCKHVEATRMPLPSFCPINAQLDQAVVPPGWYALQS